MKLVGFSIHLPTRLRVQLVSGFPCALCFPSARNGPAQLGHLVSRDDFCCLKSSYDCHRPARPGDPVFRSICCAKSQCRRLLDVRIRGHGTTNCCWLVPGTGSQNLPQSSENRFAIRNLRTTSPPCAIPCCRLPWTCARACPACPSSACADRRSRRIPSAARYRLRQPRPCVPLA